jgi:hypothetical protein
MDTIDTGIQPVPIPSPHHELVLTKEAQVYLREAGKWAKFLSIIGFIGCGLILVAALFIGSIFSMMSHLSPAYSQAPMSAAGGFVSIIYILVDILYFFFPYYLYRFSDKIKKGIVFQDVGYITRASESLKSFFKLWGIVTVIVISIYIIAFLFFVVFIGIGSHFMHQ